ncbi:SGNH/GDSL hydrolase family protein [Carnobacterium divergens]|uniref:SGNH/GDSL hydrolase family protein n=1 Tax=Carnobacterium divergens TaxID=2748 RepID=UPI002891DDE6|nr:SGNH/GDSL hydrolase family protein [Carnobacterium divergens]MDT2011492.1 SGNH/GDSL hydrolase family protein [Carnobacterium divergens]
MEKRNILFLLVSIMVTAGVIIAGSHYAETKKEAMINQGKTKIVKKEISEKKQEEKEISEIERNRESIATIDYLKLVMAKKQKVSVSFFGGKEQQPEVIEPLQNWIGKELKVADLAIQSVSIPNPSTYQLITQNSVATLASNAPDVVFFQVPVVGDQEIDISLANSKDYLVQLMEDIRAQLPEALVILVTPPPSSTLKEAYNSRSINYVSYLENLKEIETEEHFLYFDLHDQYSSYLEEQNQPIETTLEADGITMNSAGKALYIELFEKFLTQPIDTTSGIK